MKKTIESVCCVGIPVVRVHGRLIERCAGRDKIALLLPFCRNGVGGTGQMRENDWKGLAPKGKDGWHTVWALPMVNVCNLLQYKNK